MATKADTHERLIAAAMELFHARGYNAVGVKEICSHAGVLKGSFYHFYPSKRDLLLDFVDGHWASLRREVMEPAFADDISPFDRIRLIFRRSYEYQAWLKESKGFVRGCPFGNLALEVGAQDETARKKFAEGFGWMAEYFERALQEALEKRMVADIDPHTTALAILAYYEGTLLLAQTHNDPELIERLAEGAVQLVKAQLP